MLSLEGERSRRHVMCCCPGRPAAADVEHIGPSLSSFSWSRIPHARPNRPGPDEIFIIALSTNVLLTGRDRIPLRHEMAAHGSCLVVAVIVFLTYGIRVTEILKSSYPVGESAANDDLESDYTDAWLVAFSTVILLWIQQQLCLRKLMREWNQGLAEAEQDWNRDLWNTSDQAVQEARDRKRLLLDKQKEAYLEVVQPLAPYVYVFMIFCVPAVIIATRPCREAQNDINTAPCMAMCFTLLAARPVATAGVYFSDEQCRSELLDFGTLRRKLWLRLSNGVLSCAGQSELRAGDRVRFVREPSVREYDRDGCIGGGGDGGEAEEGTPYELMEDEDTA